MVDGMPRGVRAIDRAVGNGFERGWTWLGKGGEGGMRERRGRLSGVRQRVGWEARGRGPSMR